MDDRQRLSELCQKLGIDFDLVANAKNTEFDGDKLVKLNIDGYRHSYPPFELHQEILRGFEHLKLLSIANNSISYISSNLFSDLVSLESLTITGTNLETLPITVWIV